MDIYYNILPVNIHKEIFIKHKSIYVFILVNTEKMSYIITTGLTFSVRSFSMIIKGKWEPKKTFYGENNDGNILFYTFRKFTYVSGDAALSLRN